MKTIQRGDTIKRYDNETADRKVRNEGYSFVPKKVWKEKVRDYIEEIFKEIKPVVLEGMVNRVKRSKKDKK